MGPVVSYFISVFGMCAFIAIAVALSKDRRNIDFALVRNGFLIQITLGVLVLGIPSLGIPGVFQFAFAAANDFFMAIISFTDEGTGFLVGSYIDKSKEGFVFVIHALPPIIFFSSLMSVLYYLGIMQYLVRAMAWVMFKFMGTSGAESLSMAANVFVGQTEAPLVVKPYVNSMTKSELMALMTGGMATIAGGVLAGFVGMLNDKIPNIAGHLLTASVMSAPAAFIFAKIMLPEKGNPETLGTLPKRASNDTSINVIEAAARGASDGLKMALNVAAMLLAFIALIAAINGLLGWIGELINFPEWGRTLIPELLQKESSSINLSLQLIFGWIFAPLAFLMGIPWQEAPLAGALLGQKITLNEFVAYIELAQISEHLSARTNVILSYALCGFANFSSIAIQIGGIGEIAPERKSELAAFGLKAMIGGSLAAFMTACIASLLI